MAESGVGAWGGALVKGDGHAAAARAVAREQNALLDHLRIESHLQGRRGEAV